MKSLNVLNVKWKIGDTMDLTEDQLRKLEEDDLFDSYDQTYLVSGLKWKVAHRVVNPDGSTVYTLSATKEG